MEKFIELRDINRERIYINPHYIIRITVFHDGLAQLKMSDGVYYNFEFSEIEDYLEGKDDED